MKAILITEPHGEQELKLIEESCTGKNNSLFQLADKQGREVVLTGEELTSLAKQWLEYIKSN